MNLELDYAGPSGLVHGAQGDVLRFSPNLARDRVAFDGGLRHPLRFREAFSALHEVVVLDQRRAPKDRTAWREWKEQRRQAEAAEIAQRTKLETARIAEERGRPMPEGLQDEYEAARATYWKARLKYSDHLRKHDPELWRLLTPCDPIVTVAKDTVFFEAFSKDESAYAALHVAADGGFAGAAPGAPGTTNVDYSQALFEHVQRLRTYRPTRLQVDPSGFTLAAGDASIREEKIDLPESWLSGFLQVQAAMSLPQRRVPLSRSALYGMLAFLRRHRARKSPRALRFELVTGRDPEIVLEPWELRVRSEGRPWSGSPTEPIRVWGKERLLVLARLLPLIDACDVHLLGTGLPWFVVARMGEMTFTLGLSGWTSNDWSKGSALETLAPPVTASDGDVKAVAAALAPGDPLALPALVSRSGCDSARALAALQRLALRGRVVHDLGIGAYRKREVLDHEVPEALARPANEEWTGAQELARTGKVQLAGREAVAGMTILRGSAGTIREVEAVLDADMVFRRGKCACSHHRTGGIRRGPCRHLLALRQAAQPAAPHDAGLGAWFERMMRAAQA